MEQQTQSQIQIHEALTRCIQIAYAAGSPRDQVQRFISSAHYPYPWQWRFHAQAREADKLDGPVDIGAGGARGPGKSHTVLAQVGLDDCQRVDGLKCLFLRQTGVAAQESFNDLVDKVLRGRISYKKTGASLVFANKSKILLGGFKDENDIDKYIGIEYDIIIVEELNQLTEEKYAKLRGSLRTSKEGWRPRMYTSFNPGGIGHEFVKARYVTPYRRGEQKQTRFIPSTYKDNPRLNKEYIEYLEGLTGDLGRAWREGDFDIHAGTAFPEFLRRIHVMRPLIPSLEFNHYLSIDWGTSSSRPHAFAAYLHAIVPMKTEAGDSFMRVITYKEWAGNETTPDVWAEKIYKDCIEMGVKPTRGDVDDMMFDHTSSYSTSIARLFTNKWTQLHGNESWLTLTPGVKNRIARKATVHNWLSIGPDEMPYWMMTENCIWLAETIPKLQIDKNDLEKVDTDGPDDPFDSCGYFLQKVKFVSIKPGPMLYKTSVQSERVQWTKDGSQQIAIHPKAFSEQYEK